MYLRYISTEKVGGKEEGSGNKDKQKQNPKDSVLYGLGPCLN